ncbi:MAG TPA: flagellar basal body-associated FliL family protein [Spongiibacteraceae bacterium]|nr:flagellar basal body-associated FliL family protein [Spongiibacteraceae bacterium]
MAKNEEVDELDEAEEADAAKAVEAAARKKKLMMIAVVGVVLLALAGGGTWFALRLLSDKSETPASADEHAPAATAKEEKHASKESFYQVLEPAFVANYQSGGRPHYLQVSLAVMARDDAAIDAVKTHMPLLRNRVVMLLSGESFEQLQTDEGRVQLQQKLLTAIREILQKETGKPQVEQVFFTAFVMQ